MKTKKAATKGKSMGDLMGKKMPKQMKAPAVAKTPLQKMQKAPKAKKAY
jgi:hypothetical protein